MEVLVEFKHFKILLVPVSADLLLDEMNLEIKKYDPSAHVICRSDDESGSGNHSQYLIQKWSTRWNCYINIDDISDVNDGDKLLLVPKTATSVNYQN